MERVSRLNCVCLHVIQPGGTEHGKLQAGICVADPGGHSDNQIAGAGFPLPRGPVSPSSHQKGGDSGWRAATAWQICHSAAGSSKGLKKAVQSVHVCAKIEVKEYKEGKKVRRSDGMDAIELLQTAVHIIAG